MLIEHKTDCPKHLAQLQHYFKEEDGKLTEIFRVVCPICLEARPIDMEEWNGVKPPQSTFLIQDA